MVNYNESKIYKVISDCGNLIYVGSTTKPYLSTRLAQHKSLYKSYKKQSKDNKITVFRLFDEYEPENCQIILIENVNCNSKNELHARERYYIESLDCVNKNIPCRLGKEYYYKEYYKEYNKVNEEKMKEYQKEYYDNNKESKLQYLKEHYQQNKDKFNEKHSCECGGKYTQGNKSHHFSSQRHINYTIKKPLDPIPDLQESAII